jgi:hypothetical protein
MIEPKAAIFVYSGLKIICSHPSSLGWANNIACFDGLILSFLEKNGKRVSPWLIPI